MRLTLRSGVQIKKTATGRLVVLVPRALREEDAPLLHTFDEMLAVLEGPVILGPVLFPPDPEPDPQLDPMAQLTRRSAPQKLQEKVEWQRPVEGLMWLRRRVSMIKDANEDRCLNVR